MSGLCGVVVVLAVAPLLFTRDGDYPPPPSLSLANDSSIHSAMMPCIEGSTGGTGHVANSARGSPG